MEENKTTWRKVAYFEFTAIIVMGLIALYLGFWVSSLQAEIEQEEQVFGNFVERFVEIPYNQGLYTGMTAAFYELKNQGFDLNTSDLNAELLSPEFYAVTGTEMKKHGVDSISCWLIDTEAMYGDRTNYDCSVYDDELKKAKKMLKS